ncbi:MAG: hypothetical protein ACYDGN_09230 [Acidimicrobiales bacterium]
MTDTGVAHEQLGGIYQLDAQAHTGAEEAWPCIAALAASAPRHERIATCGVSLGRRCHRGRHRHWSGLRWRSADKRTVASNLSPGQLGLDVPDGLAEPVPHPRRLVPFHE